MPDLQSNPTSSIPMPVVVPPAPWLDDVDYALGCECADPSLQIERWGQEGVTAPEPN